MVKLGSNCEKLGQKQKKLSLQEVADEIKERLNYYLWGGLEKECVAVDVGEALRIIDEYNKEIRKLMLDFWNNEEETMGTKVKVQKDTFLEELNRYTNECHTSIGF